MSRKFLCIAALIWLIVSIILFCAMIPEGVTLDMMWQRIINAVSPHSDSM